MRRFEKILREALAFADGELGHAYGRFKLDARHILPGDMTFIARCGRCGHVADLQVLRGADSATSGTVSLRRCGSNEPYAAHTFPRPRTDRTPATPEDRRAIEAISPGRISYPVAIPAKRFARQMQGQGELTPKQRDYLWAIVWRYRRQIADQNLVALAKARQAVPT